MPELLVIAARMQQDAAADPWHGLVLEYPEVLDTAPLTATEVIGLYRSYVREWEGLPEAIGIGRTAAL